MFALIPDRHYLHSDFVLYSVIYEPGAGMWKERSRSKQVEEVPGFVFFFQVDPRSVLEFTGVVKASPAHVLRLSGDISCLYSREVFFEESHYLLLSLGVKGLTRVFP